MTKRIGKWILAGPGDGLKTEIVMRALVTNPIIQPRPFAFLCETDQGRAVRFAQAAGIDVVVISDPRFGTPESLCALDAIDADLLVCCGWNFILPPSVLSRFSFDCLNCHSSLLPDYKGQRAYMHQWANCETQYGVTIHFMSEKLDEGKAVLQGRMQMVMRENIETMHRRISEMTAALLPQAFLLLEGGYSGHGYDSSANARCFRKITPRRARLHRIVNRIAGCVGLPLWLTPHDHT